MNRPTSDAPTQIVYESADLELFAQATNWKEYWSGRLRPYIQGRIVEVGAGLGTSTEYMCRQAYPEWLCLDPDPTHAARLDRRIAAGELPAFCKARNGVLADLSVDVPADTILYIDVLEHIDDDRAEMCQAAAHLKPGGNVVVLSPAFNFLYSPFDKAVGHHRRYRKKDIARLTVPDLRLRKAFYLDSVGFFASLANRLLLKSTMPSPAQIALWDRLMVPASRYTDPLFGALFGKTIVMVWQKV